MLALQILLVCILMVIFFQDLKKQLVNWVFFPIIAALFGVLHFFSVNEYSFYIAVITNFLIILIVLLVLFLYSKFKLRVNFINGSFGLGDVLFFLALCLAFPTVTFTILFVFSVMFSLALHIFFKRYYKFTTVPLAGYMALFYVVILTVSILFNFSPLYLM